MKEEENNRAAPVSPAQTSEAEQRERTRNEAKREMVEFAKMVVWFLLLFLVLRGFVIEGYEVQGPSMEPTLAEHERILVFKLGRHWPFSNFFRMETGSIVVFDSPDDRGKRYVKRVIATGPQQSRGSTVRAGHGEQPEEGVRVRLLDQSIYVNNRKLQETYIREDALSTEADREVIIGPDEYFLMGDNRNISKDSRNFGPVSRDLVIGRALLRFWPLHRFGLIQ